MSERAKGPDGYTSMEFQRVREALLACNDADRAYLRRWILRGLTAAEARLTRPQELGINLH